MSTVRGIVLKRVHWWSSRPWRASFRFKFPEDPEDGDRISVVSLVRDSRCEAAAAAAHFRAKLIEMRSKGEL